MCYPMSVSDDVTMLFAEIERDSAKRTFQSWNARYPKPYKQSKSTSPLYYSFDYGGKVILLSKIFLYGA